MLENLMILRDDEKYESTVTIANLPSNEDVLKSLPVSPNPQGVSIPSIQDVDKTNKVCVVVWKDANDAYAWFLGYIKEHLTICY